MAGAWLAAAIALPCAADEAGLRSYVVAGDAIPQSLTGVPGDAARGRARCWIAAQPVSFATPDRSRKPDFRAT